MAPSLAAALGYDAMQILFAGIKAAGSAEPTAIAEAIRTLKDIQTLKGAASINAETGNLTCPVYLLVADNATATFSFHSEVKFD